MSLLTLIMCDTSYNLAVVKIECDTATAVRECLSVHVRFSAAAIYCVERGSWIKEVITYKQRAAILEADVNTLPVAQAIHGNKPEARAAAYKADNGFYVGLRPDCMDDDTARPPAKELTVTICKFPESNGKRNWTAMFKRVEPWNGLVGNCGGVTIMHGELWNRVAYHAECARALLGLRDTEPDILAYGEDIRTPEEWKGADPEAWHISGGGAYGGH